MKKSILKISVLLLTMVLLLQSGTAIFAAEGDTVTETTYPLLTHWDFDGEGDNVYADKADGGASKDTLTATQSGVTVTDGIAHVSDVANAYLSASGKEGTDLYSMANKTVVVKAKLADVGSRTGVAGFVSKIDSFSYGVGTGTASYPAISYMYYNVSATKSTMTAINSTEPVTMGEYRIFVMSFDYEEVYDAETDTTKQVLVVTQYMSSKEQPTSASDFVLMSSYDMETGASLSASSSARAYYSVDGFIANENDFILGKRYDHLEKDRNLEAYFDDVKIYDGVLSPTQIVTDAKAPTLRGAQIAADGSSVTEAGTFGIRFVGTVNSIYVKELGFEISAKYFGGTQPKDMSGSVKNVYYSILADTGNGHKAYTARDDFHSEYIYTLSVVNIPLSTITAEGGYVEFTVIPYSIDYSGNTSYGDSYLATVTYDAEKTGTERYVTVFEPIEE